MVELLPDNNHVVMLRAFLFVLSCSGSIALIVNQAEYGDTTLVFYDQYDDAVTPPGAITRCSQRGGWLVMPKDPHLNSEVIALVKDSHAWIGMGDYGIEGAYEFNDGSQFTWADWISGQPDNYEGNEDCGGIQKRGWNDYPCDSHYGYVCQIPKFRSLPYERSHFKVFYGVNETTYRGAITACQKIGSRLVRIKNERESEILSEKIIQLSGNDFWASAFDMDTESCYVSGGAVTTEDCDRKKPFACEAVEPHKVVISEKRATVDTSSDLQISCSAYGFPTPEVTWVRDGKDVKDQVKRKGHSTMNLHDVTLEDAGLYVCQAANVIDNREYKMEAYSFVEVTQGKNGEQQQWDDNDMY